MGDDERELSPLAYWVMAEGPQIVSALSPAERAAHRAYVEARRNWDGDPATKPERPLTTAGNATEAGRVLAKLNEVK